MLRTDLDNMSDEELANLLEPVEKENKKFFDKNITEYIAFYIANGYKKNVLGKYPLDSIIEMAINDYSNVTFDDCNVSEVKKILKDKYKLDIVSTNPIDIVEL